MLGLDIDFVVADITVGAIVRDHPQQWRTPKCELVMHLAVWVSKRAVGQSQYPDSDKDLHLQPAIVVEWK